MKSAETFKKVRMEDESLSTCESPSTVSDLEMTNAEEPENQIEQKKMAKAAEGSADETITTPQKFSKRQKAIIYMQFNCIVSVFYDATSKYATSYLGIAPIDLCCIRTFILILNSVMIMCQNGEKFFDLSKFSRQDKYFLLGRCVLGAIAYGTYIFALKLIPLYLTAIIFNTSPFWVAILGYFINKESVSKVEVLCIFGCFVGIVVLMLAKKQGSSDSEQDSLSGQRSHQDTILGVSLIFMTAWLAAFVMNSTRRLRHINFGVLLFYYSMFATGLYMAYIIVEHAIIKANETPEKPTPFLPRIFGYNLQQYGLLLLISALNVFAKNFQTLACQYEKSAFISLLGYVYVVYAFIVDIVAFHVHFSQQQLIGTSIIIVFNLYAIIDKIKEQK